MLEPGQFRGHNKCTEGALAQSSGKRSSHNSLTDGLGGGWAGAIPSWDRTSPGEGR